MLSADYAAASQLFDEGRYAEAQTAFEALGDYADSPEKAKACADAHAYLEAERLFEAGEYQAAAAAFTALGDYADSPEKAKACADAYAYLEAGRLFEAGEYEAAAAAYTALGAYEDAPEQVKRCKYAYVQAHTDLDDSLTRVYLSDLAGADYEDCAALFDTLLNAGTLSEYTNASGTPCIGIAFYLRPGETMTVSVPEGQDTVYTNEGEDWMYAELEIGKASFIPRAPAAEPLLTATPQVRVRTGDGAERSVRFESFTLVLPEATVEILEPSVIPSEGVMCAEGNVLRIVGIAGGAGAAVTVNGAEAETDAEGRFEAVFTLSGSEAEQVTVTAYGNGLVTASVTFTALPYAAADPSAEPHIIFVPSASDMYDAPCPGAVTGSEPAPVYSGPDAGYDALATVSPGDRFDALGAVPGWFLIEYRANTYGWIEERSFSLEEA